MILMPWDIPITKYLSIRLNSGNSVSLEMRVEAEKVVRNLGRDLKFIFLSPLHRLAPQRAKDTSTYGEDQKVNNCLLVGIFFNHRFLSFFSNRRGRY